MCSALQMGDMTTNDILALLKIGHDTEIGHLSENFRPDITETSAVVLQSRHEGFFLSGTPCGVNQRRNLYWVETFGPWRAHKAQCLLVHPNLREDRTVGDCDVSIQSVPPGP